MGIEPTYAAWEAQNSCLFPSAYVKIPVNPDPFGSIGYVSREKFQAHLIAQRELEITSRASSNICGRV